MKFYPSEILTENVHGYVVFNLTPEVERETLQKVFGEFGNLVEIQIRRDDEVKAAVIYSSQPSDQLFTQSIYIHNSLITVRPLSMAEYIRGCSQPVPASKLSLGGLHSPNVFIEEWFTDQYVFFDLNLNEKYLEFFFAHIDSYYRARIVYDDNLKNSLKLQRFNDITSLTISGKYPAYFWRSKLPMQKIKNLYYLSNWERVTQIPFDELSRDMARQKLTTNSRLRKGPINPRGTFPEYLMKLNMWTVYRLEFRIPLNRASSRSAEELTHEAVEQKLSLAAGISLRNQQYAQILVRPPMGTVQVDTQIESIPSFNVRYMLEHAFNLKILRDYNVAIDFFEKMRQFPPQVSCMFLSLLSAPQQRVYNADAAIAQAYRLCKTQLGFQQPLPEGHVLQRRVIITPTSIYPLQPTVERMTHLQRRFHQYADRFLLVRFTDEDLSPIVPIEENIDSDQGLAVQSRNNNIYDRIYSILKRGLRIAGRTYEFLGSSLSDLRSHSCWFFSPVEGLTRNDILSTSGDFSDLQTTAAFVNCSGQSFQPALLRMNIKLSEIEVIDDFIRNNANFSKDCGKMSPAVAREISSQLGMDYTPSVVKFNLAGARGILSLSNFLMKRKIQLRPCQIHFQSEDTTLEVIKVSKPNKLFLNNRFVTVLSSMGVRSYVFDDLLDEGIAFFDKHRNAEGKDHLSLMIDHYSNGIFSYFGRIVVDADFLARFDPFITNVVKSFQNSLLTGWKEDTRLYVHQGVQVFAIVDETNTLEKGEVFLQLTRDRYGQVPLREVIRGRCLVYRNASCFPSDFRIVNAVDYKELRHWVNVLVYSANDLCDLPTLCSNDDFDEENVNVIWDKRLIPTRTNPTDHRNYAPAVSTKSLKKISFNEAAKFVTTYISKDISATLEETYIALADRHKEGVFNGSCMHLSQQISRVLDFAKTGIYVHPDTELHQYLYPNFMRQSPLNSYTSDKPVGQIYQKLSEMKYHPSVTGQCSYDPRLYLDDMYKYIKDARKTKAKYDHSLRLLLAQFSVQTEIEFVSGNIVHWPKYIPEGDKAEYCERIRSAFIKFRAYWKDMFEAELNLKRGRESSEDAGNQREAKAAAWYYVTYHPSEYAKPALYHSALSRYLSFPWIVDEQLSNIAIKNTSRPVLERYLQPVPSERIEQQIEPEALVLEDDEDSEEDNEDEDGVADTAEATDSEQQQIPLSSPLSPDSYMHEYATSGSYTTDPPVNNDEDNQPTVLSVKLSLLDLQ